MVEYSRRKPIRYAWKNMIESKYIEGEFVPVFDEAVTAAVKSYRNKGGGNSMRIAIENFDGKAYRVIECTGLGAFMHAIGRLQEIGLKDILEGKDSMKRGCDCWFVTTPEMLSSASSPDASSATLPLTAAAAAEPHAADAASEILSQLESLSTLPETERQSIIQSRVGQGLFRSNLVLYWKGCAVTEATCIPLLKASHIKPWRDSNNKERLDSFNGLLLSPNLDAAFDSGLITFDPQGKIILSSEITGAPAYHLHINGKMRINQKLLTEAHQEYLAHHRTHVFRA